MLHQGRAGSSLLAVTQHTSIEHTVTSTEILSFLFNIYISLNSEHEGVKFSYKKNKLIDQCDYTAVEK